jgi:hypothetical protein
MAEPERLRVRPMSAEGFFVFGAVLFLVMFIVVVIAA